jgi:hypothetical protein
MKTLNSLLRFAFGILTLVGGILQPSKACLDTIPRIHSATCFYDATNYSEMVVRIGSLRTAATAQGTWCTCAIHNNHPVLDFIDYIAVVDSGTNNRAAGFGAWYRDTITDAAWDSVFTIGWQGFLSQLVLGPTVAGTPVELVIRAQLNGYTMPYLWGDLRPSILAWDNWDFNSQVTLNVHRWWRDWPIDTTFVFVPINQPTSFFSDFDADLLYVGADEADDLAKLQIFPNPVVDVLNVKMARPQYAFSIRIYDATGKPVAKANGIGALSLNCMFLTPGIYFAEVQTAQGTVTRKFTMMA